MTYNVFSGTLNLTQSITHDTVPVPVPVPVPADKNTRLPVSRLWSSTRHCIRALGSDHSRSVLRSLPVLR